MGFEQRQQSALLKSKSQLQPEVAQHTWSDVQNENVYIGGNFRRSIHEGEVLNRPRQQLASLGHGVGAGRWGDVDSASLIAFQNSTFINYKTGEVSQTARAGFTKLVPDGVLGPRTAYALDALTKQGDILTVARFQSIVSTPAAPPALSTRMIRFPESGGWQKLSTDFWRKFNDVASSIGVDGSALAAVVDLETARTWSSSIQSGMKLNSDVVYANKAVGLVQFLPFKKLGYRTAVGKTAEEHANQTPEEQLDDVRKYFQKVAQGRPIRGVGDLYLLTFSPANFGKSDDTVIYSGGEGLRQNPLLAENGVITVGSVRRAAERHLARLPSGLLAAATGASSTSRVG